MEGDGEGGERGVQQAVAEGRVDGDGEADGGEEHLEGAHAEFVHHFFEGDVPFFEAGVQGPIPRGDAEPARFVDEEAGRVGFVEDEDVKDEDGHLKYAGYLAWVVSGCAGFWSGWEGGPAGRAYVLRPSPSEGTLDDGTADDGTDHGPADHGECIAYDGGPALCGMPKVA